MENNNENKGFQYSYSAKEQAEIKRIREKYVPHDEAEDKMTRLRRLDASATRGAQTVAVILGVIGCLILGLGMSLCMTELGELLGDFRDFTFPIGIATGLLGALLACFAYPVYHAIVRHRRKKLAPEILRLTEELMN